MFRPQIYALAAVIITILILWVIDGYNPAQNYTPTHYTHLAPQPPCGSCKG